MATGTVSSGHGMEVTALLLFPLPPLLSPFSLLRLGTFATDMIYPHIMFKFFPHGMIILSACLLTTSVFGSSNRQSQTSTQEKASIAETHSSQDASSWESSFGKRSRCARTSDPPRRPRSWMCCPRSISGHAIGRGKHASRGDEAEEASTRSHGISETATCRRSRPA